jgi:hypothetical protein
VRFYKLYKCIKFDYNRPFFGGYAREIPWTPARILMWSGDTGFGGSRRDRAYQSPPRHILDGADRAEERTIPFDGRGDFFSAAGLTA